MQGACRQICRSLPEPRYLSPRPHSPIATIRPPLLRVAASASRCWRRSSRYFSPCPTADVRVGCTPAVMYRSSGMCLMISVKRYLGFHRCLQCCLASCRSCLTSDTLPAVTICAVTPAALARERTLSRSATRHKSEAQSRQAGHTGAHEDVLFCRDICHGTFRRPD